MISLACQYTPRNSRKSILRDAAPSSATDCTNGDGKTSMRRSGQRVTWRDDAIEEINVIERLTSESESDTDSDHIVADADIDADIEDDLDEQLGLDTVDCVEPELLTVLDTRLDKGRRFKCTYIQKITPHGNS